MRGAAEQQETPAWPCSGIRVVEFGTSNVSGPFAAQILGDLGADVIKLEGLTGDVMRAIPPFKDGRSGQFLQFNRNKRSIAVDFKSEKGKRIALALIDKADVLIENFRPGVIDRLGFGYGQMKARNPGLIFASVNGFGASGPYAQLPAYDMVIQGLVGFMPIQSDAGGAPAAIRSVIVDKITSVFTSTAITSALLHRERGGNGQKIDVKMMDAFAAFILPELLAAHSFVGEPSAPLPNPDLYRPLKTADGHVIGLISTAGQFAAICKALGRPDLIEQERFSTPARRFAEMGTLLDELETRTETMTTAEVIDLLWATKEVPIAPVNSIERFLDDPQAAHNGTLFEMDDGKGGAIRQLGRFADFGIPATDEFTRAPDLGEHADAILCELGFDPATIGELRAEHVIV